MDRPTDNKERKIASRFKKLGYDAVKFFQEKESKNPDDKRNAKAIISEGAPKSKELSNTKGDGQKDKALRSIDATLLTINQIKQYSNLSKDIRLKERNIRESIISILLPVNSPASKEFAELALDLKKFYGAVESGNKDEIKSKDLGLIEFKLKNDIASRADMKKVLDLATGTLKEVSKETSRAVANNSKPEAIGSLKAFEKSINTSLDKISDKVKYDRIEKMQKDLLSTVVNFENKLDQSEKESRLKSKGLIKEPKPPVKDDKKVERLIDFVKNFQTVRYQRPEEIEKRAGTNQDKLKEHSYRKNSVTILERTQSSLGRDKNINNYEGRTKQREAVIIVLPDLRTIFLQC